MRRRRRPATPTIVDECTAFLSGTYGELVVAREWWPLQWTWINLPAHGTQDEIEAAAVSGPRAPGWAVARSYLCREVLDVAARTGSLEELHRELLVPLELRLARRRQRGPTSDDLVALLLARST